MLWQNKFFNHRSLACSKFQSAFSPAFGSETRMYITLYKQFYHLINVKTRITLLNAIYRASFCAAYVTPEFLSDVC